MTVRAEREILHRAHAEHSRAKDDAKRGHFCAAASHTSVYKALMWTLKRKGDG